METTQKQASIRLFKKLSALRATLSNEERAILDNLIVVEEVAAHRMTSKAVSKAVSKAATKATSKAAEVAAHKMTSKATTKATSKAASQPTFRIAFDPNSEEYKITE
jgi:ribosomal protein L21